MTDKNDDIMLSTLNGGKLQRNDYFGHFVHDQIGHSALDTAKYHYSMVTYNTINRMSFSGHIIYIPVFDRKREGGSKIFLESKYDKKLKSSEYVFFWMLGGPLKIRFLWILRIWEKLLSIILSNSLSFLSGLYLET